jgi:hypothetical protein
LQIRGYIGNLVIIAGANYTGDKLFIAGGNDTGDKSLPVSLTPVTKPLPDFPRFHVTSDN